MRSVGLKSIRTDFILVEFLTLILFYSLFKIEKKVLYVQEVLSYYIKWVKTSWIYSRSEKERTERQDQT